MARSWASVRWRMASSIIPHSSTSRTRYTCRRSSSLGLATKAPRLGIISTSPSYFSRSSAGRMEVRLVPVSRMMSSSMMRLPGNMDFPTI